MLDRTLANWRGEANRDGSRYNPMPRFDAVSEPNSVGVHMKPVLGLRILSSLTAAAALSASVSTAWAEDVALADQKFQVSLGTFVNKSTLTIRADGETSEGTTIEWGDTFGDQEASRLRLDGYWRFKERHHLRFMYTDYGKSSTRTLERDIEWNGEILPVSASATARLGFEIIELAYEYDFARSPDRDLVLSAGVHYTTFEASIRATVDSPVGGGSESIGSKASVDAPLPVFGARGMWRLGRNFYLDAQVQYFALAIDQYDGSLVNYRAALIWQPKTWIGLGAGFDSFNIDVKVDGDRLNGELDWTYQGPQVFFNFAF